MTERFVSPDDIRTRFSRAMSRMYREEVPAYGALCDLVAEVNGSRLPDSKSHATSLARIAEERHGARASLHAAPLCRHGYASRRLL